MKAALHRCLRSRTFWGGLSAVALLLVFAAYLQPDLMVELANFVRSCF